MRRIFRAAEHEAQFERDGVVLVEGLGADAVTETEAVFRETSDPGHEGWHHSLSLTGVAQRQRIDAFLRERFGEALAEILDGFSTLHAAFSSKGADPGSAVPIHQDWSLVDERSHRSLSVWIPLCDTTHENGGLAIVKGSHRLPHTIRGTGVPASVRLSAEALSPYLTRYEMQAGDALFFDHRMIHTSPPNTSGRRRTAAAIGLVPNEVPVLHYVGAGAASGPLREFQVDRAFFVGHEYGTGLNLEGYICHEVAYEPVAI